MQCWFRVRYKNGNDGVNLSLFNDKNVQFLIHNYTLIIVINCISSQTKNVFLNTLVSRVMN